MSWEANYLKSITRHFTEYKMLGEKTFDQLRDEHFYYRPNESSNSLAVIIKHLHGNMLSRWTHFLTEDGEKDWRRRDEEFEEMPLSKTDLIHLWQQGWKALLDTLASLQKEDLGKTITIRSQPLLVIDAINRQLAHYSYHVGQIVYLGRWILDKNWTCLSIPKNASQYFNENMKRQHSKY